MKSPAFCDEMIGSEAKSPCFTQMLHLIGRLDALFRTVEALGGSVNQNLSLQIRGENVFYRITEGKTQATHALTKDEQKQWEKYEKEKRLSHYALEPKFRKYDYIPNGKLTFAARRDSYLRDTDNIGLEGRLGEILLDLYRATARLL